MTELRTEENVTENAGAEREAAGKAEPKRVELAAERVVDAAFDLGRLWAKHGLGIGRMALETSAEALKTTAGLLQAVEGAFEPPQKSER
jgi:hypothetical protein